MHITVVGTGYVGLVTGTCFAESGNDVCCVDIDAKKIENLRNGILPIYEPGLGELVERNLEASRLTFSTDLPQALGKSTMVFIAVGTPQGDDGSADLRAVWAVSEAIRKASTDSKVVVVKSTVPVGTSAKVNR